MLNTSDIERRLNYTASFGWDIMLDTDECGEPATYIIDDAGQKVARVYERDGMSTVDIACFISEAPADISKMLAELERLTEVIASISDRINRVGTPVWIKCSDKLPEIDSEAICYMNNSKAYNVWILSFKETPNGNNMFFTKSGMALRPVSDVSYWMPLPKEPK